MDYARREVMIAMRDGVKLHTVILVPNGAKHEGILLTRTPYAATMLTTNSPSAHLGAALWGYDNATETIIEGGYIRVVQDIRGKYGSEGDYIMNRPIHGALNPTPVDESTDTYDTIDWLIKNIPETNGKVGVLGISYDGYLALMPLIHPHPALKVRRPHEPHGRRLARRRLVPQRGLPPAKPALHLRADRDPLQRRALAYQQLRRLRHVHERGLRRRAGHDNARWTRSASGTRSPHTLRTTVSGADRPSTGSRQTSPSPFPPWSSPACGTRKTSTAPSPSTKR